MKLVKYTLNCLVKLQLLYLRCHGYRCYSEKLFGKVIMCFQIIFNASYESLFKADIKEIYCPFSE